MKLKTRRMLLLACTILFFLIFPIVLLQSLGYRYDSKERKLVRTGIIYLTATPQDNIKIFIDGKEETDNLSIKGIFNKEYALYNLIPQTYDIRVSKDGYSTWEKNLPVTPGLNTYARPLLLTLNPAKNLLFEDKDILNWSISGNFKKIAYLKKTNNNNIAFSVYNTENKTTNSIVLTDVAPDLKNILPPDQDLKTNFFWDARSENIMLEIISKTSSFTALNTGNNAITYLGHIKPNAKIINSAWTQNNNFFIFQTDQKELYSVNMQKKPDTAAKISDNIYGFTVKNNTVYYLDADNLFFYSFPADDPAAKKQVSNEPLQDIIAGQEDTLTPDIRIKISNSSDIAIINSDKDLFLVRQNNSSPIRIGNNINFAEFSANGSLLLYSSLFEIYIYSIDDKSKDLITRLAQKVEKTSWYKDDEHIWFINNNTIKNIEIDPRPNPNIIDFASLATPVKNFSYDASANTIYYDQLNNGSLSVYRLTVGN